MTEWRNLSFWQQFIQSQWQAWKHTSRACMSKREVTLGKHSCSSSREDVRTWKSSCASWEGTIQHSRQLMHEYLTTPDREILKNTANLLFRWTDLPAIQSENIQEAFSINYMLLYRLIAGQSCQCRNKYITSAGDLLARYTDITGGYTSIWQWHSFYMSGSVHHHNGFRRKGHQCVIKV